MGILKNDENKKKNLISALLQLAGSAAVLLLLLPIGEGLNPLRRVIYTPFGSKIGLGILGFLISGAGLLALKSLLDLLNLLSEHFHLSVNWGRLFYGAAICLFGAFSLFIFDGIGTLFGIALLVFGGWVLYSVIKNTKTKHVLDKDGETIYAEITDISHSLVSVNDRYTYTVTCRAGNRYFTKKTHNLLNMSCIGKKVSVWVSASNPDVYDVDIDHIFLYDPESSEPPEVESKPHFVPNPDTSEYSWRWNKSECEEPAHIDSPEPVHINPPEPIPTSTSAHASTTTLSAPAPVSEYSWRWNKTVPQSNPSNSGIQKTSAIEQTSREPDEMEAKPYSPLDWYYTKGFLHLPFGAIMVSGVFLLIALFISSHVKDTKSSVILFFLFFSPGLIFLLIEGLNLLKKYRLYRYGQQVRAKICSARQWAEMDGDPVYKAVCTAGDRSFSGSLRLKLRDSELVGKWVTVFVSSRNPKHYIIEGNTLGKEF